MKFEGKLIKEKGDQYWGAEVPELGVYTQGKTKKDTYKMVKEAVELVVDFENFEVSIEPGGNESFFIIPNNIGPVLALILKQKRLDNGLTIRDVAMRLGQSSPNSYGRYESGKSIPTLEKFDELLAAISPDLSSILKVS